MNPLGINLWNWVNALDETAPGLIHHVADLGFTAVELPMTCCHPGNLPALTQAVSDGGLAVTLCVGGAPGRSLASPHEEERRAAADYLSATLDCARALGATVVCGALYGGPINRAWHTPEETAQEWAWAVAGLRDLSAKAADLGVVLALEPLSRYRTSMVNTCRQALQLVDDVGSPALGVLFDSFHANIEESDLPAALRAVLAAGKLAHVHACDNHRGAPGTGHLPWAALFSVLTQGGYGGHLTLETFRPQGLDAPWVPVEADPDRVAASGLAFLRQFFPQP